MHKTGNVLSYFLKSIQAKAKQALHETWMAEARAAAEHAFDHWLERYEDKHPKATACLARDGEELPPPTTSPRRTGRTCTRQTSIQPAFTTIRHRSSRAKGCVRRQTILSMIYKMGMSAERSWRRLRGFRQLGKVIERVKFADGIEVTNDSRAAA